MGQTHPEIKFLHFREVTPFGVEPRGGVTVAYYLGGDAFVFSAARCSYDDNFVKATGRKLAKERLKNITDVGIVWAADEKQFAKIIESQIESEFGFRRKFSRKNRR